MLTLVSYPGLFGLADNNPYGLKIFAFLKLCRVAFEHEHRVDTQGAPRGQLPYIVDDGEAIGDSDAITAHLIKRHDLAIDAALTEGQRGTDLLVRRTLDDLYWVMSYSRWKDPRFWEPFRDAFLRTCPGLTEAALDAAREYNAKRYYYQGIGRYEPDAVYARGVADLGVLASLLQGGGFLFGERPSSTDAGLYGFVANIYFFEIDTPLKVFLASRPNLVDHCRSMHALVGA